VAAHRKLAISDWSESHSLRVPQERVSRRFWHPCVIGLVGTLVLHGLAIQTAVYGSRAHRVPPPDIRELGSSQSTTAPAESLVFIDIPSVATPRSAIDPSLASALAALAANPLRGHLSDVSGSLEATPLPSIETNEPESSAASAEGTEHARLLGIYSGQIQARVERLWIRPRTGVNEGTRSATVPGAVEYFYCQVQIVQDSMGHVQEILLTQCNGSSAWQCSLAVAIEHASPLPAPPSPSVFSRTITVNFVGYPYVPGGSEEGYETLWGETAQITVPFKSPEQVAH